MAGNSLGKEGAKALGPHMEKLNNMTTLDLAGGWCCRRVYVRSA